MRGVGKAELVADGFLRQQGQGEKAIKENESFMRLTRSIASKIEQTAPRSRKNRQ